MESQAVRLLSTTWTDLAILWRAFQDSAGKGTTQKACYKLTKTTRSPKSTISPKICESVSWSLVFLLKSTTRYCWSTETVRETPLKGVFQVHCLFEQLPWCVGLGNVLPEILHIPKLCILWPKGISTLPFEQKPPGLIWVLFMPPCVRIIKHNGLGNQHGYPCTIQWFLNAPTLFL